MRLVLLWAGCCALAAQPRTVVPFVGCDANGQAGAVEAPTGEPVAVALPPDVAAKFAYYESPQKLGVLAPRGWHCFGVYGSGGDTLIVAPGDVDRRNPKIPGDGVEAARSYGGTSGRYVVAQAVARIFPRYRRFVKQVIDTSGLPASDFPSGPYPADTLRHRGNATVEYRTRAASDGLGTRSVLQKNDQPIEGVAILVGPASEPDLLHLSVRLAADLHPLTPHIVTRFRKDAARTRP